MSSLSAPDLVLAGVAGLFGLVIGWLIWGGRRAYINELEDHLASARKSATHMTINAKSESANAKGNISNEDMTKGDIGNSETGKSEYRNDVEAVLAPTYQHPSERSGGSIDPLASRYGDQQDGLVALGKELEKIRQLLGRSKLDSDPLKEYLDQTDTAIKRANGRLQIVMSNTGPNKPSKD